MSTINGSATAEHKATPVASAQTATETYLFGSGIGSSLSPVFHDACYRARGADWTLRRIDSPNLDVFLQRIHSSDINFGGSAVTMPHKASILKHVDAVEDQAKIIGAANTVFFRQENGQRKLVATNTDVAGIRDSILAVVPKESRPTASSSNNHIGLVIGGGGTTRTSVYTLRFELHCKEIYIINRLDAEVEAIVADFAKQGIHDVYQLKTPEQVAELREAPRFIVNAIPCMEPVTDGEKLARATLAALLRRRDASQGNHYFLEMCYFPHTWTDVCEMAKQSGFTVVQGMECMYHQAVAQQLLWLGSAPKGVDLLAEGRAAAEEELRQRSAGKAPH
ncbi:unnamed protein product [Jaminaea pallidilutea]